MIFLHHVAGYALGGVVVASVLFGTRMAQPALLYLCPLTLGGAVLCAYLRGGRAEVRGLWMTNLPSPSAMNRDSMVLAEDTRLHSSGDTPHTLSYLSAASQPDVLIVNEEGKGAVQRDRFLNT